MKKFRIIFAVMALVAIFAAPAYADLFYLYSVSGAANQMKVAPLFTQSSKNSFAMYNYPQGLTLSATYKPCIDCINLSTTSGIDYWLFVSSWQQNALGEGTDAAQVAYMYPYAQQPAWGMDYMMEYFGPKVFKDSYPDTCDTAVVGSHLYLASRGTKSTTGTPEAGHVTVYDLSEEQPEGATTEVYTRQHLFEFTNATLPNYLAQGDVAHPEVTFAYTANSATYVYVLLSVENSGNWKNHLLVRLKEQTDSETNTTTYNIHDAMWLTTDEISEYDTYYKGDDLAPYISSTYVLLATGHRILKIDLSSVSAETKPIVYPVVTGGVNIPDWGGRFLQITSDDTRTYILTQTDQTAEDTLFNVYKIATATLIDTETLVGAIDSSLEIKSVSNPDNEPFIVTDSVGVTWIYLGTGATILYCEGDTAPQECSSIVFSPNADTNFPQYAIPTSARITNPSDTQIPDSGGGCNAGATAAMLAFCALPFFFRKKH